MVLFLLCVVALAVGPARTVWAQGVHEDLYFDIWREGSNIGTQTVRFYPSGDDLKVSIYAVIKVTIAGITVYRRTERRTEEWQEDRLVSFTAETDDDGRIYTVDATLEGNEIKATGSAGTSSAAPTIIPATYWNASTVEQSQLIDTKTGRILNVSVSQGDPVTVVSGGREIEAQSYSLSGDANLDLWYDENGKWVGLRLIGRDGSVIEYRPQPPQE
jgi:hypothetical protein